MTPLFEVKQCFRVGPSGCMLAPGISAAKDAPPVQIGSRIRLQTPDGAHVDTYVRGMERVRQFQGPTEISIPIFLPNEIRQEQVPVGTQVYLLEGANPIVTLLDGRPESWR